MANPFLNEKKFQVARTEAGWAAPDPLTRAGAAVDSRPTTMTMNGTLSATAVLFALLLLGGVVGWRQMRGTAAPGWWALAVVAAIGTMILTNVRPRVARITGPIYAVAEGLLLGGISHALDNQYKGIVLQAVGATTAVVGVMIVLQRTRIVRVTDRMRRVVVGATLGVAVFYLATIVLGLFGFKATFLWDGSPLAIVLSVALAGLAAFRFLVELDFVERQTRMGSPRELEWFAAFGLLAATVWLYLEILRLLANLNRR